MTEDKQPSARAMKAAVEMELHAACSTMTIAKGRALDDVFPAYDDLLAVLKDIIAPHFDEDGVTDPKTGSVIVGLNSQGELVLKGSFMTFLERARSAVAKTYGL